MTLMRYILRDHTPVECPDLETWSKFMRDYMKRRVALTDICQSTVSTVFLGVGKDGNLFESMVLGGPLHQTVQRYPTWQDAVTGHQSLVRRVHQSWVN